MNIAEKLTTIANQMYMVYGQGAYEEYKKFWNNFIANAKKDYGYAFYGSKWGVGTYNPPPEGIEVNRANNCFSFSGVTDTLVPIVFVDKPTTETVSIFANANSLVTVNKVVVNENVTFASWFTNAKKLENITFEGVIANDINFSVCPLTLESAKNVIFHLADFSSTDNAFTRTITFSATTIELLNAAGYDIDGRTWREYLEMIAWNT
jgi:hypothetical protein